MKFTKKEASLFIPDGCPEAEALSRTTHLAVGAHPDDIEIMAFHGIIGCYRQTGMKFGGITCSNGSGSARSGIYADYSDEDMIAIRHGEQEEAARIGQYAFMAQLFFGSKEVKDAANPGLANDLLALLRAVRPETVYTHNLADKHDTHVAVTLALIEALRRLPREQHPRRLLGCEVWRDLDWLPDNEKVALDVSGRDNLAMSLMGVYDSQIAGGKRYDLATMGRRRAHATYAESHVVDKGEMLTYAMDLTPLLADNAPSAQEFLAGQIGRFQEDVLKRLAIRRA